MDHRAALRLRRSAVDPGPTYHALVLSSTWQARHILSRSRISLQLVKREYKEVGGICRIGRQYHTAGMAWASGVSVAERRPWLHAHTKVERVCVTWVYSCRTTTQRTGPCMSTTTIRAVGWSTDLVVPTHTKVLLYAIQGFMPSSVISNDRYIFSQCYLIWPCTATAFSSFTN